MVDPLHARCGEPGSKAIQGTESVESEEAEQPTPSVQCRSTFLHWKPTRAVRGTDCDSESGAAVSEDEADGPATGVGAYFWIEGPEHSFGNSVKGWFKRPSHCRRSVL